MGLGSLLSDPTPATTHETHGHTRWLTWIRYTAYRSVLYRHTDQANIILHLFITLHSGCRLVPSVREHGVGTSYNNLEPQDRILLQVLDIGILPDPSLLSSRSASKHIGDRPYLGDEYGKLKDFDPVGMVCNWFMETTSKGRSFKRQTRSSRGNESDDLFNLLE